MWRKRNLDRSHACKWPFGAKVVTRASEYSEIHSPPGTYTNAISITLVYVILKRCICFFSLEWIDGRYPLCVTFER